MTDRPQIEFICPLCREQIQRVDPAETPGPAGLQERIEQIIRLDEQAILGHFEISHTMQEVVMAMGQARAALVDIRHTTERWSEYETELKDTIAHGLGEQ